MSIPLRPISPPAVLPARGLSLLPAALPLIALLAAPALAGPVVCTTTLEAPAPAAPGTPPAAPVEVTRCGPVETVPTLVERRFFSHTAPFARGVSVPGQITDLFGIARGGLDGRRRMGFGFVDQTIVWDGVAVENTTRYLLDRQSDPMPLRTADIPSGFTGSLRGTGQPLGVSPASPPTPEAFPMGGGDESWPAPVRGLW
jgi:hypothetical protein